MDYNIIFSKDHALENVKIIIDKELPLVSNLSNLSALLIKIFDNTSWCGFYLNGFDDYLYLGPYQGDIACTKIKFGKGVCGDSALRKHTNIVKNVHDFPGHIACSASTNSEIVVPIIKDDVVYGVIDLDSNLFGNYNDEDAKVLESISNVISELFISK